MPRTVRWALLRASGARVGGRGVAAHVTITGRDFTVGRGSFINRHTLVDTSASVLIGERCGVGMGCMLITSTHKIGDHEQRVGQLEAYPISVGDGSWLGARVTVLPGVTIGAGCVVAAGSVVVNDLAADGLYGGVPARLIRDLGSAGVLVGAGVAVVSEGPELAIDVQ